MYCIAFILDDWNYSMYDTNIGNAVEYELDKLLEANFPAIAPNVDQEPAISCIYTLIRNLETRVYGNSIPEDLRSRIFFHVASMLQRMAEGKILTLDEEHEEIIRQKAEWFDFLSRMSRNIFQPCGFDIPRSECFYLMASLPEAEQNMG